MEFLLLMGGMLLIIIVAVVVAAVSAVVSGVAASEDEEEQECLPFARHILPETRKEAADGGSDNYIFLDSSMVEHSAVNRVVAGSSPARGAGNRLFDNG